jgi:hypothetical protein
MPAAAAATCPAAGVQVCDAVPRAASPDRQLLLLRGSLTADATVKALARPLTHQQQLTLRRARGGGRFDLLRASGAAGGGGGGVGGVGGGLDGLLGDQEPPLLDKLFG